MHAPCHSLDELRKPDAVGRLDQDRVAGAEHPHQRVGRFIDVVARSIGMHADDLFGERPHVVADQDQLVELAPTTAGASPA